jgi:hypothetical protein
MTDMATAPIIATARADEVATVRVASWVPRRGRTIGTFGKWIATMTDLLRVFPRLELPIP